MNYKPVLYSFLGLAIILCDRFTKIYAMGHWNEVFTVNPYLFFQVTLNRGISWGLFNSNQQAVFVSITAVICFVTAVLVWYAHTKVLAGKSILGELCIIAGSLSNIYDRLIYGGVIDFIAVHKDNWIWPLFNIADASIVFGVMYMFFQLVRDE